MCRTIDAIWRSAIAEQIDSKIADRELYECASEIKEQLAQLQNSAENGHWQQHYDAALEICRLSRRIRFRFVEPENFDTDTRNEIVEILVNASAKIRSDDEMPNIVPHIKSLDEIRQNIEYRIERIVELDDQAEFPVESETSNS